MAHRPSHALETPALQLPGIFQKYRSEIDDALRQSLSRENIRAYDMLRYYMGWVDVDGRPCVATTGKALRPTLCLFACEASGSPMNAAMPAAVALEFIHNFSLIHDDIQDRDETRHHRLTLWAVWGEAKALVAGNVLRVVADICLEDLTDRGLQVDRALHAITLLTEAYLEMIEGQYLDLSYEGRPDISLDDYLGMVSRKTGALIRCSMNLGAAIGSREGATIEAFRACGQSLGLAFQVRDDILGVWGDQQTTGKPVGADIRRKKNSFPVVYAMSQAKGADRLQLKEIYEKDGLDDDDVAVVLEIMERTNVREHAQTLAARQCAQAHAALASLRLTHAVRQELDELVHFLLVRQY